MTKLWLDDIRPMPETYDVHCKTAKEAIDILGKGKVTHISFDHDLGPESAGTGYRVACFIEKMVYLHRIECPHWKIHSANPVGRANIETAMTNAENFE